jgi:hypothetical protein
VSTLRCSCVLLLTACRHRRSPASLIDSEGNTESTFVFGVESVRGAMETNVWEMYWRRDSKLEPINTNGDDAIVLDPGYLQGSVANWCLWR